MKEYETMENEKDMKNFIHRNQKISISSVSDTESENEMEPLPRRISRKPLISSSSSEDEGICMDLTTNKDDSNSEPENMKMKKFPEEIFNPRKIPTTRRYRPRKAVPVSRPPTPIPSKRAAGDVAQLPESRQVKAFKRIKPTPLSSFSSNRETF